MATINKAPKEITACARPIAKTLCLPSVFVTTEQMARPNCRYHFSVPGATPAVAGNRTYAAIPLVGQPTMYWLAANIDVKLKSNPSLTSVSIVIFRGESETGFKLPVFRAEWHRFEGDNKFHIHAQPHWHVYTQEGSRGFTTEPAITDFRLGQEEDSEFHYAMAARWHEGDLPPTCDLDLKNVCTWLNGCISYILGEFIAIRSYPDSIVS